MQESRINLHQTKGTREKRTIPAQMNRAGPGIVLQQLREGWFQSKQAVEDILWDYSQSHMSHDGMSPAFGCEDDGQTGGKRLPRRCAMRWRRLPAGVAGVAGDGEKGKVRGVDFRGSCSYALQSGT